MATLIVCILRSGGEHAGRDRLSNDCRRRRGGGAAAGALCSVSGHGQVWQLACLAHHTSVTRQQPAACNYCVITGQLPVNGRLETLKR